MPIFSVIIPLEFHRGQSEQCIRCWVGQAFPEQDYELLVVIPPDCSKTEEEEIAALLRSHDRVIRGDEEHDIALCAVGADAAQGRILFFTESHCWPEADALGICLRTFEQRPDWAGFSCLSKRVTPNALARVEADMYEGDMDNSRATSPWLKLFDHCFATRREAYEACGGLRRELGHYAEWVLSANYHARGLIIGYQPEAVFHHFYIGQTSELVAFTRDFVTGEFDYLDHGKNDPGYRFMARPYEWACQGRWDAAAWLTLLRIARRTAKTESEWASPLRAMSHRCIQRFVFALHDRYLRAPFDVLRNAVMLRLQLLYPDHARLSRRFRAFIESHIFLRRMQCGAAQRAATAMTPASGFDAMAPGNTGFYPAEARSGQSFRWTEPIALLRGWLPRGAHEIVISTMPDRAPGSAELLLFFVNDERIPRNDIMVDAATIRLRVTAGKDDFCHLAMICAPEFRLADGRPAGMPLREVSLVSSQPTSRHDRTPAA
jgi:hypothetical protein